MAENFEHLKETLESAPREPGVYLMKDGFGEILYIGKAKSLRSRVRSYFQGSAAHSPRISLMVGKVRSIDMIVTSSEVEALVLEDNLIKKEKPRFNVMLRDDKNYPYLKLTTGEAFPRLTLARRVSKDGGAYFGPYVSAKAVRATMRLIHKIFPLRQSRDDLEGKPPRRPCLNHQMGRCLAPCAGKVSKEDYRRLVDEVAMFLRGRNKELANTLRRRMREAADEELFELAARYRDQLIALEKLNERQLATDTGLKDEDLVAAREAGGKSIIKIFQVRRGKIIAERHFLFDQLDRLDRAEALAAFIRQFYADGMEIPPAIIVNETPEGVEALEERLSAARRGGGRARIIVPLRGRRKKLLEMAERNAGIQLESLVNSSESRARALADVGKMLGLPSAPRVVEGYDVSNTGGLFSVGSVVLFRDGEADKSGYRKYKIKTVSGADDYASLAEVVERRWKRLAAEDGSSKADLLVIDGGKGQVKAVVERFGLLGIDPPPIVGIAKGRDRENADTDLFYVPGSKAPLALPASSPARAFLQRVRDEAHRFAISYHRKTRADASLGSSLDSIPGIGPKRKKLLLRRFGSMKKIRDATVEEIMDALSVSEKIARRICESL